MNAREQRKSKVLPQQFVVAGTQTGFGAADLRHLDQGWCGNSVTISSCRAKGRLKTHRNDQAWRGEGDDNKSTRESDGGI